MDGAALAEHARTFGLNLTRTQLEAFALFEARLYEVNTVMNLTRVPKEECWSRHFLDSLILSPLIPKRATVLDIGSGPGLPGSCLAIARPDLTVTCLDSGGKAVGFLSKLFGAGGHLPVLYRIIQRRAEELAHDPNYRETFDFVTGRAVAPLPIQAEISAGFVKVAGQFVPMRTPADRGSIGFGPARVGLQLVDMRSTEVKPIGAVRFLPMFRKTGRIPRDYPRTWAQIKAKPLGDE